MLERATSRRPITLLSPLVRAAKMQAEVTRGNSSEADERIDQKLLR